MADIECQLLAEVDRVVSSPYPTQLKSLRDIVCCKCSAATISRCLHLRRCAVDRLAVCLIEGLSQWPYVLDIVISLASIHILRDALLRQAPGLLHELAELAIKTENARSKYTRATVSVLSHPLPENVALPASVQCLFLRLVDNAAEHPSTATVKPLNMMLSGTSTQLLGLLPNDVLLRFEKQMLGILYSSVQKPNQEMDQHLTLRCLFAISVVVKGADDRLMLTNSFYETQELLASTQQDSSRWNANEMRKFFLDGESVPKTIRLLVLQALSACSSSGGSLDERAEGLAHVNDLVAVIPQNLRDNWCAANGQMIQKFQAKAVAAEHGELRLQLLSFVCQLCKPVFLQLATVESIQNTVSDLDLLLSANVAADASAWYYCMGATIDIATLERLIYNLARFSSNADADTLVLSAKPISELLDRMLILAQETTDVADAATVALSTSSFHSHLLELSSKIQQCRTCPPLDSVVPFCNALYHNSLCSIGFRLSDFLLKMQMAGESSRVTLTATTDALLELHAISAKDPAKCKHQHLGTKIQYRPLSIVEHESTPAADGSDWRETLQSFLASEVAVEYSALSAMFARACEDLEKRCTDVEQPLQEEKAAHLCVREQYGHLQEDYAALETQSIDTKLRCDSFEADWKNSLRDLETAREESDCLLRRVSELEEKLRISAQSSEAKIAELRTARDKDKLENASAAAKKQEELEDLQESHQELERDAEIRSQELTDLRQSTRAANAVKDDLQRRLDEACRGIENKSAEVEDLRMSSESHASVSSKLKSDLDAVIQQSEQQRQSHEQSIQRLKEENRQNQQSVNAAHNETMDKLAAQHGEEAARYESELSSVKEALATTRTQYTEELARRRDGMDDAQSQIDRLLQKCKQKDQQIADANAMRANLMAAMGIAPAAEATQMSSLPHRSRKSIHRAPSRPYDRLDQSSPHPVSGGGGETRDYNEQDPTAPNDLMEKGPTPKRPRSRRSLKVQSPVRPRSSMNTRNSRMSAPGKASANRQPLSNVSTNQSPKKPARTRSSKFEAKEIGNEFDETTLDGNEMIGHGTSAQMEMDMDLSSMLADGTQK
ncbi:hypothetical protein D0869_01121 [Hortaea werneckii]|uniref:Uncharacterized protein n=1 Tax=Hortaea werneckii TaxID=91943 RepID=A0A3M6XEV1_HORWE|nr:hypothetical protein D0869_01121 [Hortaea werneckii]